MVQAPVTGTVTCPSQVLHPNTAWDGVGKVPAGHQTLPHDLPPPGNVEQKKAGSAATTGPQLPGIFSLEEKAWASIVHIICPFIY